MTSADDFFGSPTWDEAAQAEFALRIRRVPKGSSRARRFEHKAWALFYRSNDTERQRAAVALLERGVTEAHATASAQATLLERAAFYQIKLGQRHEARATLERLITLAPYDKRTRRGLVAPELLLARLLVESGLLDSARAVLDEYHRARGGSPSLAALEAEPMFDSVGAPLVDPELAAETIVANYQLADPPEPAVPFIATATRASLLALDHHFAIEKESLELRYGPTSFKPEYLSATLWPALGAYFGRVLVNTQRGAWRAATPLGQSRVVVAAQVHDPFAVAYDALYYGVPLVWHYDRIVAAL